MDAAEKGQRYARIFRKAGLHLGKGNIALAVAALKEGLALAQELGDHTMAARFDADIKSALGVDNPSKRRL